MIQWLFVETNGKAKLIVSSLFFKSYFFPVKVIRPYFHQVFSFFSLGKHSEGSVEEEQVFIASVKGRYGSESPNTKAQ